MGANRGQQVQTTLQEMEVHDSWSSGYRTPENECFYGMAFDYLAAVNPLEARTTADPRLQFALVRQDPHCGTGSRQPARVP